MSVLIIEDDRPFVELLRHWLGERKIRIAETLAEANKLIATEAPKFLVVDLTLPDSSAIDTLSKIRTLREESKDAVVIVITGAPQPEFQSRATEAGADLFLSKDEGGFFSKLTGAIVNPPRPPNVPVELRRSVDRVENATRTLLCDPASLHCPPTNTQK